MNITSTVPSARTTIILEALQQAVTDALERKQKLGQYAVVWEGGKPVRVGEDVKKPVSK